MNLTAVLTPAEDGGIVALNPETGTTTQGEAVEEAIANLREATALDLAEFACVSKGPPLVTTFSLPEHASTAARIRRGGGARAGGTWLHKGPPERKSRPDAQGTERVRRAAPQGTEGRDACGGAAAGRVSAEEFIEVL
jgi:predicted RNase H-like HicB family nuclease